MLRPYWEQWSRGLDTNIDYYLQNLKNDLTIVCPYVISISKGQTPLAILVAYLRNRRASTVVSMVQVPGPRVKVLEIVPGGDLGLASAGAYELLATKLSEVLTEEVDLLCFRRLSLESQLFREISQMQSHFIRMRVAHVFSYSVVDLFASSGERLAIFPGKAFREVRRKTSNLQREFPGAVTFKCFSLSGELDSALRDVEKVSVSAWQHSLGRGFTDALPSFEMYRVVVRKGWLRIFILYLAGQPCAYLLGQLYRGKFYCQRSGYRSDFARFSVGSVLTALAFENLASSGARQVDLGEGNQEHNRRLGSKRHDEATVHVYAPTLRGFSLNLFFGATNLIRSGGRRTRSRLRLTTIASLSRQYLNSR
jgi:Acetyltransferase (GNAT) domain